MDFLPWRNAMIAPPNNGVTSHSQQVCQVELPPVRNLDPFGCYILPPPFDVQCQAEKVATSTTSRVADCSRLPPKYQPYCRALPPAGAGTAAVGACGAVGARGSPLAQQNMDPTVWPNTSQQTKVEAAAFGRARARCASVNSDPRNFYSCLWASTKYPHYPEFGPVTGRACATNTCQTTLLTRDNCNCAGGASCARGAASCGVKSPFPIPQEACNGTLTGGWTQVNPQPSTAANDYANSHTRPKVWAPAWNLQ